MITRLKQFFDPESDGDESDPNDPDDTLTDLSPLVQYARLEKQIAALTASVAEVEKQLTRLSKEQFKANALGEDALSEAKVAVAAAIGALSERSGPAAPAKPPPAAPSNTQLLEALMPVLDSIEAGLQSGQNECEHLADEAAKEILLAWLDGQRLLRDRLLALFDKENVRPIQTIGQLFDPYRHVAVETVAEAGRPVGTIVAERRRGYEIDGRVLRFAEVTVASGQDRKS